MEVKLGGWYQLNEISVEELRSAGAVISPSSFLHESLRLCFPIHLSPRVQIKNNVSIDKFSFLNWDVTVYPNVYIGGYCSIGRGVQIGLAAHPVNWLSTHAFQYDVAWFSRLPAYKNVNRRVKHRHHRKTKIGADVWIGNNAQINAGVSIGHGSVIGAGAVVTKDVPPYAIVGGVPAKLIRYRFPEKIREKLLQLKWWELNVDKLSDIDFSNIENAISQLQQLKDG